MLNNPLATLPLQQLKNAVAIREKIVSLEQELSRIIVGQSLRAKTASSGKRGRFSAATRANISATKKTRRARVKGSKPAGTKSKKPLARGLLKDRIIGVLKSAGKTGVTVKEMSAKLGTSYGNVSVWFHTTAKRIKAIKKVAPGTFAWAS